MLTSFLPSLLVSKKRLSASNRLKVPRSIGCSYCLNEKGANSELLTDLSSMRLSMSWLAKPIGYSMPLSPPSKSSRLNEPSIPPLSLDRLIAAALVSSGD